jgi:hypothetical protein
VEAHLYAIAQRTAILDAPGADEVEEWGSDAVIRLA